MKIQSNTQNPLGRTIVSLLTATLMSVGTFTVSAKDEVPVKFKQTSVEIDRIYYEDGSYEITKHKEGISSHFGRFTGTDVTLVSAPVDWGYDPELHAFLVPFQGMQSEVAANGDSIELIYEGIIVIPLDASNQPLLVPLPYSGTYEILGGTGRFEEASGHGTFEGFAFDDGTTVDTGSGVMSTVGSNKR